MSPYEQSADSIGMDWVNKELIFKSKDYFIPTQQAHCHQQVIEYMTLTLMTYFPVAAHFIDIVSPFSNVFRGSGETITGSNFVKFAK